MRRVLIILGLLVLSGPGWAEDYIRYHPPMGGTISVPLLAPAADNCAAVPYSFTGDTNSGLCESAADTIRLYQGGASVFYTVGTVPFNTFIGVLAGASNVFGGVDNGDQNTFVGSSAGRYNTSGYHNTFIGTGAGQENTTAPLNTFIGTDSGLSNTQGHSNTFIGTSSGSGNTTGDKNMFIGTGAGLVNANGNYNVGIGYSALNALANSDGNIAIGNGALGKSVSGTYNIAIGYESMTNANTTGTGNTSIGSWTGYGMTGADYNTSIGQLAGGQITSGDNNTLVGYQAGRQSGATPADANGITTGSTTTFIGVQAGYGSATQRTNATAIGYQAYVDASNTVVLGDENIASVLAGSASQASTVGRNTAMSLTADAVIQYGQVVMPDASADGRFDINATNSTLGIGVLGGVGPSAQGTAYPVINSGLAYVVPQEDAAVTRGHYLIVSATAGCVNDSATVTTDGLNIGLSLYSEPVSHVIVIDGCGGGGCINTTTGAITLDTDVAALGWAVGQPVVYWDSGGTAPTGLTTGNVYFLKTVAAAVVTISATYGGAAVVPSDQGNDSTQYLMRLPQAVIAIH